MALRHAVSAAAFECFNGRAHIWRLVVKTFDMIQNGVVVERGTIITEKCDVCHTERPYAPKGDA